MLGLSLYDWCNQRCTWHCAAAAIASSIPISQYLALQSWSDAAVMIITRSSSTVVHSAIRPAAAAEEATWRAQRLRRAVWWHQLLLLSWQFVVVFAVAAAVVTAALTGISLVPENSLLSCPALACNAVTVIAPAAAAGAQS